MSSVVQLDLFINEQRQKEMMDMDEHKKMVNRSIKGLFARYNEMEFVILEMNKKIDRLNQIMLKDES